jgi:hypothetical protein
VSDERDLAWREADWTEQFEHPRLVPKDVARVGTDDRTQSMAARLLQDHGLTGVLVDGTIHGAPVRVSDGAPHLEAVGD